MILPLIILIISLSTQCKSQVSLTCDTSSGCEMKIDNADPGYYIYWVDRAKIGQMGTDHSTSADLAAESKLKLFTLTAGGWQSQVFKVGSTVTKYGRRYWQRIGGSYKKISEMKRKIDDALSAVQANVVAGTSRSPCVAGTPHHIHCWPQILDEDDHVLGQIGTGTAATVSARVEDYDDNLMDVEEALDQYYYDEEVEAAREELALKRLKKERARASRSRYPKRYSYRY
eukprot:117323_1